MKKAYFVLAAMLVLFQGSAFAEVLTGTVTGIEGNRIMLTRSDNQENLTIKIQDQSALSAVQPGTQVTVDANKGLMGGWKATSLSTVSPAASTAGTTRDANGTNALSNADVNASDRSANANAGISDTGRTSGDVNAADANMNARTDSTSGVINPSSGIAGDTGSMTTASTPNTSAGAAGSTTDLSVRNDASMNVGGTNSPSTGANASTASSTNAAPAGANSAVSGSSDASL
jgi:hypothetical protein